MSIDRRAGRAVRSRRRLRVEALEPRALLAVAGTLDPSFGTMGLASTAAIEPGGEPVAQVTGNTATAVQADGEVLVGTFLANTANDTTTLVVERFTAAGSIDPGFGLGGQATATFHSTTRVIDSILVAPDGAIDVVAQVGTASVDSIVVVQFESSGVANPAFGTGGVAELPTTTTIIQAGSKNLRSAIQPDGKVLVTDGTRIARLDTDGTPDSTFGSDGTVSTGLALTGTSALATGIFVQSTGRIVVVADLFGSLVNNDGLTESHVLGFLPDGSVDSSFGGPSAQGDVVLFQEPPASLAGDNTLAAMAAAPGPGDTIDILGQLDYFYEAESDSREPAALVRLDADGMLDPTFGDGGYAPIVRTTLSPASSLDFGMAVQPDGKIVLDGTNFLVPQYSTARGTAISVARFNVDGSFDATFNPNSATPGVVQTTVASGTGPMDGADPGNIVIAPDGSIVVGATDESFTTTPDSVRLVAARYFPTTIITGGPSGQLDPNLGNGLGYTTITAIEGGGYGYDAVGPDGKLVVVDDIESTPFGPLLEVERLGLDERLDPTFGAAGLAILPADFTLQFVAIQADGKILMVGRPDSTGKFSIERLDADGSVDTSFGTDGFASTTLNVVAAGPDAANTPDEIDGLAVRPGGPIDVLAQESTGNGSSTQQLVVEQFTAAGVLDPSFGTQGRAVVPFPGPVAPLSGSSLSLGADGKLVVASASITGPNAPSTPSVSLARLDPDGSADLTFGTAGLAAVAVADGSLIQDLAIQPDGKVLLLSTDPEHAETLYRLNLDGTLDGGFGTNGRVAFPDLLFTSMAAESVLPQTVVVLPSGQILLGGQGDSAFAAFLLDASGRPINTFGNGAVAGLATYSFGGQVVGFSGLFALPDGSALLVGPSVATTLSEQEGDPTLVAHLLFPANPTVGLPVPTGGMGLPGSPSITPPTGLAGRLNPGFGNGAGHTTTENPAIANVEPSAVTVTGLDSVTYTITPSFSGVSDTIGMFTPTRFLPDNTIDASYGQKAIAVPGASSLILIAAAIEPDGKVVLDGTAVFGDLTEGFVARLNIDGTLDAGFGTSGFTTFTFGSQAASAVPFLGVGTIAFGKDGLILVAGAGAEASGIVDLAVAGFGVDGMPYPYFGQDSVEMIAVAGGIDRTSTRFGVTVLPDGDVIAAGTANQFPSTDRSPTTASPAPTTPRSWWSTSSSGPMAPALRPARSRSGRPRGTRRSPGRSSSPASPRIARTGWSWKGPSTGVSPWPG